MGWFIQIQAPVLNARSHTHLSSIFHTCTRAIRAGGNVAHILAKLSKQCVAGLTVRFEKPMARWPNFGYCSCPLSMIRPFYPVLTALSCAAAALLFSGCKKPVFSVFTVPKEAPAPEPSATAATGEEAAPPKPRPKPQVTYTLPAGWKEEGANSLSLVNFFIKTDAGEATVNITPLTGMQGREGAIVNMWRAQLKQPALSEQEVAAGFTPVEIDGQAGEMFEVSGSNDGQSLRIVTAFAHRDGQTWFYKLQGNEQAVAAQKPVFVEFLKTVKIKEGPADATAASTPPAEPAETTPAMVAPESWKAVPAGQMQVAKFAVQTADGAKADVSVSIFPSDTGGTLENVKRWRRQLGLPEADEAGLQASVTPLEGASIDGAPGGNLVDLTNENRRLLGAIVPRDGRWWFYKMMGDAAAVNAEKENFVHFVKTQP